MSKVEIVDDWPPNIEDIRAVLPVSDRNIFAYDGKIYNPGGGEITKELVAHEKVHFAQQGKLSDLWWEKFLEDPAFRLAQEMPAHRAEYVEYCRTNFDRNRRVVFLRILGKRLADPMYGGIIGVKEAMRKISNRA